MGIQLINQDAMNNLLLKALNKEMAEAAEPVIKKAIEDAAQELEKVMRKRLAQMLIALIQENYSAQRHGNDLIITVRQAL